MTPPEAIDSSPKRQAFLKFPLGLKVSLVFAATVTALGLLTAWVVRVQLARTATHQLSEQGLGLAGALSSAVEVGSSDGNTQQAQALVKAFSHLPNVSYVVLVDSSGHIQHHTFGQAPPKFMMDLLAGPSSKDVAQSTATHEVADDGGNSLLDVSVPMMHGGEAHVGLPLGVVSEQLHTATATLALEFSAFVLVGILVAYQLTRLLVKPLYAVAGVVGQVSTGDLNSQASVQTRDEFLVLGQSINDMISNLRGIVSSVRMVTRDVDSAAEAIVATSRQQERGVTDQVAGFEEISQTMTALADTARAIATNAGSLTQTAENMSSDVQRGQTALSSSRQSMAKIVEQNAIISDRIHKLFEQSESIITVIDIIDNISDRLDLLALNAALEGSRAGEVGRGFSLVAAEMRRLAENVSGSTKEIKDTIQDIHGLVRGALEASQQGSDTTQMGAQEMELTVEAMSRVFNLVESTTVSARQITVITQQQLSSSQAIAVAMRDVAAISMQGVQAAREVTSAAKELATLSSSLQSKIAVFRVEGT